MTDPYRAPTPPTTPELAADPGRPELLQTWTSNRTCPICAVPLFAARQHGIRLDACGRCGGCFLPNDAAHRMLASTAKASVAADLASTADARATVASVPVATRNCPDCDAKMGRARVLGIEVGFLGG